MKLIADYHTHTKYSHGKDDIIDNVREAKRKNLEILAISEHGPGHYLYGVKEEEILEMRRIIDEINIENESKGLELKVLLGLEANILGFDGKIDVNKKILENIDILLLGYHYGVTPNSIKDFIGMYILNPISKFLPFLKKKMIKRNTEAFIKAINRYPVKIITHPGDKVEVDIVRLAKECIKNDVALEINSKHNCLSVEDIQKIKNLKGLKISLGSDAHKASNVGNVDNSIYRAKIANLDKDLIINIKK